VIVVLPIVLAPSDWVPQGLYAAAFRKTAATWPRSPALEASCGAPGSFHRTFAAGEDLLHSLVDVAFLSGGAPQHPLVESVAADDFEGTREHVAVIRDLRSTPG
jgi:hypothetical protein